MRYWLIILFSFWVIAAFLILSIFPSFISRLLDEKAKKKASAKFKFSQWILSKNQSMQMKYSNPVIQFTCFSGLLICNEYCYHRSNPWVTKTEFLLTISIQYQADKWWEKRKISITILLSVCHTILKALLQRIWYFINR